MLVAKDLGKTYQGRKVVKDISLYVVPGEVVGLLGPNGAGKSTTFYMIAGILHPEYGKIIMNDRDITELPIYRRVHLGLSYLPQEPSIFRGLTVYENILAAVEIFEDDRRKQKLKVDELLEEFSVSYLADISGAALSGGERRRVEIARCVATKPKYLLLDEPLAGVDPIATMEIKEIIAHLKKRGVGVLITDHNVKETLSMIDRAYIVYDGMLLADGTVNAITQNEKVKKLYLGKDFST